jgi:hypothetical protein
MGGKIREEEEKSIKEEEKKSIVYNNRIEEYNNI